MAADFWAGYISGAIGILIGNPLDLIKVRLQAGTLKPLSHAAHIDPISPVSSHGPRPDTNSILQSNLASLRPSSSSSLASASTSLSPTSKARTYTSQFSTFTSLLRGSSAPILGYGALNALLFMTYNRSSSLLTYGTVNPPPPSASTTSKDPTLLTTFIAGALGGLATWVVSTPTELVKCRAQVATSTSSTPSPNPHLPTSTSPLLPSQPSSSSPAPTSYQIARDILRTHGIKGLYAGGLVTSLRDSIGYGFYFWSYEASTRYLTSYLHRPTAGNPHGSPNASEEALKVLLCGGCAGVITWASVFPLDVIKTRVQTQTNLFASPASSVNSSNAVSVRTSLLQDYSGGRADGTSPPLGSWQIAKQAYRNEGASVFFRGLGVCSIRAFVVNAVQWAVYERIMNELVPGRRKVN